MQFHKILHPLQCVFADRAAAGRGGRRLLRAGAGRLTAAITDHGDEVFHLALRDRRWGPNPSQAGIAPWRGGRSACRLAFDRTARLTLRGGDGAVLLAPGPLGSVGVHDRGWMLEFAYDPALRFYGMGEKCGRLEKTGTRTRFYTTDVWADFAWGAIEQAKTDPMYVSIPYVILQCGKTWIGLLLDNPYAGFACTGAKFGFQSTPAEARARTRFYVGSDDGAPDVWVLVADSLAALTRKHQRLVGTTPLPPLWALGHHQCRWGYRGRDDLNALDRNFRKHGVPTDGLWLDIDYMDGFRVFTWSKQHFRNVKSELADLAARGRKVVPILDPGVKDDPAWKVRNDGLERDVFCRTAEGRPYVGFVWPGETLFPDFSRSDVSAWWADHVARFAKQGAAGAWVDMNDPAVGPVALDGMRFDHGRLPHEAFHSQYGLGMARATRAGFLKARPQQRPFVLSRSGFIGQARHSALWTGDNVSNDAHLKGAIPCTLNLALSGVPFNGPDVPGFGKDPDDDLAVRWYQAGFLFPFFRNHACKGTRNQEPWTFGPAARRAIFHAIRLRYKLLPYLYNLFIDQEERGEAILRPLIHDFASRRGLELDRIDDQFLVGASILQAPFLERGPRQRLVTLPKAGWLDACTGAWLDGDRAIAVEGRAGETPLYLRAGSLIPMLRGLPRDNASDLATIELHCVLRDGEQAECRYRCDDGETFAYQRGVRSDVTLRVRSRHGVLHVAVEQADLGWKPLSVRLIAYGGQTAAEISGEGVQARRLDLAAHRWAFTGAPLACRRSPAFSIAAG